MADNGSLRPPRYPFTRSSAPAEPPARDAQANDPLSELARLIGQQDPFVDPVPPAVRRDLRDILAGRREPELPSWNEPEFAERRDPHMPGRRESDWAVAPDPPYQDPAQYQDYQPTRDDYQATSGEAPVFELPRLDPDHPPAPYEVPSDYGQGSADIPLYGDNGQLLRSESQPDQTFPSDSYTSPYQPEEAPPRGRKSLVAVIAVFCLAVAGTAGAYAYRTVFNGTSVGTPPLIRADSTPNKVPAAQSAEGAGKQIYDRFGGDKAQNEKVVSREEQPVDVRPAQSRPAVPPPQPGAAGSGGQAGWPTPAGTTSAPPPSGGTNAGNEPRKIRTIPIRSDQVASAPSAPEMQAAPPTASPPPTQPAARSESRTTAAPRPSASTSSASSSSGPLSLTPQGSSRTASAAPPPRTSESASGAGGYVVQLAAHKTQDEASAAFRSAQSKYPSVLGSRKMLIRKKEVPGHGTFYGAQVGPFTSRTDAVSLCENLKSAGGTCIVQRN